MALSESQKCFQTGFAVLIQYRRVTDTQPTTLPKQRRHLLRSAGKNWVLVCWWWHFDWSFARLI